MKPFSMEALELEEQLREEDDTGVENFVNITRLRARANQQE